MDLFAIVMIGGAIKQQNTLSSCHKQQWRHGQQSAKPSPFEDIQSSVMFQHGVFACSHPLSSRPKIAVHPLGVWRCIRASPHTCLLSTITQKRALPGNLDYGMELSHILESCNPGILDRTFSLNTWKTARCDHPQAYGHDNHG